MGHPHFSVEFARIFDAKLMQHTSGLVLSRFPPATRSSSFSQFAPLFVPP
jgi:hypothetical protein